MVIEVSKDYINHKSKYRNLVLSCCTGCRNVQVYRITDDLFDAGDWGSVEECDECESPCNICVITKYQKPPGFARKCSKCDFKFTCATTKIEEIPTILVGVSKVKYAGFQMCIKSGTGEECVGESCPVYDRCMDV